MTKLIIGIVIFFSIHSVSIFALDLRNRLAEKNIMAWRLGYSLLAFIGIALICIGYGEARLTPTVLYVSPVWMYYLSAFLLLPVFILLFAPYFPGVIQRKTRHPMLVAIKLWALAHLLVNGTLADVLLFGSFLAWAVADRISMKHRTPRHIPSLPKNKLNDLMVTLLGLSLYVVFIFWLHEDLFGVDPIAVLK